MKTPPTPRIGVGGALGGRALGWGEQALSAVGLSERGRGRKQGGGVSLARRDRERTRLTKRLRKSKGGRWLGGWGEAGGAEERGREREKERDREREEGDTRLRRGNDKEKERRGGRHVIAERRAKKDRRGKESDT